MFCGSSSFAHVDPGDDRASPPSSAPSTPRGSRCRSKKGREPKNPYSSRGLDRFYAVLAELEARKQRIVEKVGETGSMVRFEYSDSQWVPIVVRIPTAMELAEEKKRKRKAKAGQHHHHQEQHHGQQQQDKKRPERRPSSSLSPSRQTSPKSPQPIQSPPPPPSTQANKRPGSPPASTAAPPKEAASRCPASCRAAYVGPPCQGLRPLVVLALILVCLAAFGRTFAICCTCAWWYLAPSPTPACMVESGGGRRWVKSKTMDYGRRASSKNLGSASHAAEGSPPKQRVGGLMSPPKQRQGSFLSPPKPQRLSSFMSPPKSRQGQGQVGSPPKPAPSLNRRRGSSQL